MGIYLGNIGNVELTRKSLEGYKESIVNPSDVNAITNRFSFDFDEGLLITGDLIEIATTDGTDLDFVDASGWAAASVQTSGNWYAYVDQLGGIKLYDTFDNSLEGGSTGLVSLVAIARDIPIRVNVRDRDSRILGRVSEYEINTSREAVDFTALGDQYRQQYSSLITGSGSLTAEWDYVNETGKETVQYLMQLVLRTEIGSSFRGKFYIKSKDTSAASGSFESTQINDSLWWEFDALVTNSATSFASGRLIVSTIQFVATGPIQLRSNTSTPDYLLQESSDKISLEQNASEYLTLEALD